MNQSRGTDNLPIHKRIIFLFVLSVAIAGITISGLLIILLSPPIKSFLNEQFESNLRLASNLGIRICETHFDQLLDLRLEDNVELNTSFKKEALSQIEAIGKQIPKVHMLVLEDKQNIKLDSSDLAINNLRLSNFTLTQDKIHNATLGKNNVKIHTQYFPFWKWHIVSFVKQRDYFAPIHTAHRIIYLSTMGVLITVFITLLIVFYRAIENPIKQLIAATKDVSDGKLIQINPLQNNEIGQLAGFFNHMVKSLKGKSEEVIDLIDQLKESEKRYRGIIDLSPEAVFVLQDEIIKFINPSGVKIFGAVSHNELIEKSLSKLIHPDCQDTANTYFKKIYDNHITLPLQELICLNVDNQAFDVEVIGTYIEYLGKPAILIVVRDITERKKSERALRENEEQLEAILKAIPDPFIVYDAQGYPKYLNPAFVEVFGWSLDELKGKRIPFVPDDEKEITAIKIEDIYRTKKPVKFQTKRLTKNHDVIDFVVSASITEGIEGRPSRLVVNLSDVSEQRRLQAQFQQAQKMESVGRLAGGVAHDFNNMLSVILGYTELALEQIETSHPVHGELKEIYNAAQRSANITKQLLAFARRQTADPRVIDLNDTIAGMLKMLRRLIGEDIELAWMPGAPLYSVKIDPAQIDQILANLCVNAKDAIDGVGKITIETRNITLDETYCAEHEGFRPNNYAMLAVSDDGVGMDSENIENLFEPFYTTKKVGEGTGLGLATVYGIVKQNNGFINVYSEPGLGTTFKIYIPRTEEPVETELEPSTKIVTKGNETVLVVEDEESILNLSKAVLKRSGYTVLTAKKPSEALEITQRFSDPIQLLVTDVVMPEMNGNELSEHIKRFKPNIKILFMSGYTTQAIVHRGILESNVNFIQKPFSVNSFAIKVREVLDEYI